MAQANTVQANLIEQLRSFNLQGFQIVLWDDSSVKISQGAKGAIISYNGVTDLYNVQFYSGTKMLSRWQEIFCDQLEAVITEVRGIRAPKLF